LPISKAKVGLAALATSLLAAAAIAQQKPESILPPGFDQPATPAPSATRAPARPAPAPTRASSAAPVAGPVTPPPVAQPTTTDIPLLPLPGEPLPSATPTPVATDPATGLPIGAQPAKYILPASSRRSLDQIGITPANEPMMDPAAFGNADGRYIEALMRRTNAPIASRWVSIAMRRLLVQPLTTPHHVNGADFAAERAWLLLRMGESVMARAVVQSVDTDDYTPKLYQVAMQAALATGDPAAACPLVPGAVKVSDEHAWPVMRAVCSSLTQVPAVAKPLMNEAKRNAGGIDLQLAQKVAGKGSLKQDVTIEWTSVPNLNIWRYGMAMAAGEDIPDELLAQLGPQVPFWRALAPGLDPVRRADYADAAAAQGVLSNLALVDLYGAVDAGENQSSTANGVAADLRTAYTAPTRDGRLGAMRGLWQSSAQAPVSYGRLILTARAASRLPVLPNTAESDQLIASMISAGLDRGATRWKGTAARGSLGWALIALADPTSQQRYGSGDVGALSGGGMRAGMFAAGLAGLGRLDPSAATGYGVDVAGQNSWTRAIDSAAAERRPGEVLVLASVGMQTRVWQGVSPTALYHIVRALRTVGLGGMARMVAAEAVTRT
jgi:hypothetical protein